MSSVELVLKSAHELHELYKTKKASPQEVLTEVFTQMDRLNPLINAFSVIDREGAFLSAKASEERWLKGKPLSSLDGIPTTLKDSLLAKGWPTRYGSLTISAQGEWHEDAPTTAYLREAGAVLVGKTTMCEFGWKGVTDNRVEGVTRNPWDLTKTPGGSSGGAAAATRCGIGALAVGSDGGGSIRIPASFCGLVGLKPTLGLIPNHPLSSLETLVSLGPITRTVRDAAYLMDVIARRNAHGSLTLPPFAQHYEESLKKDLPPLKIAYSENLGFVDVSPSVRKTVEKAVLRLSQAGFDIEPVDNCVKGSEDFPEFFNTLWEAKSHSALMGMPREAYEHLDPGFLKVALDAEKISLIEYLRAERKREELIVKFKGFFTQYSALITPTMKLTAFELGRDSPNPQAGKSLENWVPFTSLFNMTQHPAVTLPCGFDEGGLPVGLQLVGPHFSDEYLLRLALNVENLLGVAPFPPMAHPG